MMNREVIKDKIYQHNLDIIEKIKDNFQDIELDVISEICNNFDINEDVLSKIISGLTLNYNTKNIEALGNKLIRQIIVDEFQRNGGENLVYTDMYNNDHFKIVDKDYYDVEIRHYTIYIPFPRRLSNPNSERYANNYLIWFNTVEDIYKKIKDIFNYTRYVSVLRN